MARNKKYVTIESPGKISDLGGILGPIKTPSYLDIDIVIRLINSGKAVYEVNPANINEKIRLTRMNVLKSNFNYSPKSQTSHNTVKGSDVGVKQTTIEPSTVETTIVRETGEGMIGTDIFISNKYS